MDDSEIDEIEIDQLALNVLSALDDLGGEANSREVRDFLGEMQRGVLHYRLDEHLVPQELVTTEVPDSEPGRFPAKILTITDRGKEYLKQVDHDGSTDSDITRRVEQLEGRINSLEQENQQLREQNRELQSALEQSGAGEVADELRGVQDSINSLQDRVRSIEQEPILTEDRVLDALDAAVLAGNTAKLVAQEEFGEERVLESQNELEEMLNEKGKFFTE